MNLFFITNSPSMAKFAISAGVDRIFVDLEIIGKEKRQGHLSTVISRHNLSDVIVLRSVLENGRLLVRVNPIHEESAQEIDAVVAAGADIIMLPMFHSVSEVKTFINLVSGRARTSLLVETIGAMTSLEECISIPGVNEVHIGLNDLHLEMKKNFMFELFSDGHIDTMARTLRKYQIPFGIGGVARLGEGLLPAERLLAEHVRVGSNAAILSRTFHRQSTTVEEIQQHMDFADEVKKLKDKYEFYLNSSVELLNQQHRETVNKIIQISHSLVNR
ncbi:MAG TPA: aldolase/citrate lyase family protein [Methylotenera sp.]|nr:aldolase/citrate lyase family protein [Methylotenera sp.]HPH04520.1 aldolase/citrate lyase family protein [Methylotenera sp.]HPN01184.1 aldolase/citrate lyase family protein [Methylotenera sp.]